jgi:hypothetical protein
METTMRIWTAFMVPGIAAMAILLLGGSGASGIDEMATARIAYGPGSSK